MTETMEARFGAAVLRRDAPVPDGVTSWTGPAPRARFGVYRNNVASALIEALGVRYPVVRRLVGEDFFRAMTRDYVMDNLPKSRVLIGYGADYPDFIAGFEPAAELAYLADVARLESAHWEAYHAADAAPADPAALAMLAPDDLAVIRTEFHPAAQIVASRFPVVSIWQTNTHDETVRPVNLAAGEDALVTRPGLAVEVRRLPRGAAIFLGALQAGRSLADAAGRAAQAEPEFDLPANLAGMIEAGVATRFF